MNEVVLYFNECEHDGDLENYKKDIVKSGGIVIATEIFDQQEVCSIRVRYYDNFWKNFEKTDAYDFCENV